MQIKHVIFDCFGTLISTGNESLKATKQILDNISSNNSIDIDAREFYKDWKKIKKEMMSADEFQTEKKLFELSLADTFHKYGIKADASIEVEPMIKSLFGDRRAFPDVKETLEMLDELGAEYAIGSTTDTDSLMYYLEMNQLEFKHIYTSEDMKVYKPKKAFYETIIEMTGWNREECLFVGDSIIDDVMGPQSIGMKAVLLDRSGTFNRDENDVKPDYVISSLTEIKSILLND